jgi:basic membrane lipoprotein Med (substrate-binding protein (PBP1-ABC) superfamily)/DNA-binding SARP family transcriptional activator
MQFRVLGTLEATTDGAFADLGPPKQRALLASLLLHVGEIVPVDQLIDLLWGSATPRTAPHSIQIYVSNLRRAFEPLGGADLIVTRQPGYLLDADRDSIDAYRFERLVHEGVRMLEAGERDEGRAVLHEALALWRGPALSDFTYEEFAQPHIRRLNEMHLDAIETLAAAELEAGRTADAVGMLTAATREDPLRERSRELLMLGLYRSGRHADALRTFDALRTQLGEELGIDPSPGIRALYGRILLHDPSLMPEPPAAVQAEVRNPYKGLRPFTEEDAADFFGRDGLVGRLADALAAGTRLICLVGPSGSGKSSVVAAGLVPRLRTGEVTGSARWRVARMVPGANPLREAVAAVTRAGGGTKGRAAEHPSALRAAEVGEPTLLVIDQFEQVFTVAEAAGRGQFLAALADAVSAPDARLRVILNLRGDFYDRPLLHPDFAAVFTPSVVNVVPMTARELEEAIVEPARRAGVEVEAALLAELIGDTADRPGSLPLLQYALTELFEQRSGSVLTRSAYATLGGLRGLLTRRAESLYLGLDPDAQQAAMQVFLRLVHPGSGAAGARRRLVLSELTDLGIDPVVLSEVLTTFGRHRLLTFDRDAGSSQATVEVAHEALLVEWDRLAGWIEQHRSVLRRHAALMAAAEEWELSGRDPDYLLTGSRLREFEPWREAGVLQLSGRERAFLDAAVAQRRTAEAAETARVDAQRRAERRARWRFAALGVTAVLLAAGLTYAILAGIGNPPRVALFTSTAEGVVGPIVESAFDRAVGDFGLVGRKIDTSDLVNTPEYERELRRVSEEAVLVIIFVFEDLAEAVTRDFPDTRYMVFDYVGDEPNVAYVTFKEWEAAFLAGAAAALKTMTGTVGFIGGMDGPPIWGFAAGYAAGARAANAGVEVVTTYLGGFGEIGGFLDTAAAEAVAERMYADGVDVIFNVAGSAGLGIFDAAAEMSGALDRHLWAIGVDSDQYETVVRLPGATRAAAWQPHILTSMLKRFDVAVYGGLEDLAADAFVPGMHVLDLASGGVDISYSGGFLEDVRPEIERYRSQIIAREIAVPCIPDDRIDAATEFAEVYLGMSLEEVSEAFGCAPPDGGT